MNSGSRDRSAAGDLAAQQGQVSRWRPRGLIDSRVFSCCSRATYRTVFLWRRQNIVTITIRTDKISHVFTVLEIRGTLNLILDPYVPRTGAPGPIPAPAAGSPLHFGICVSFSVPKIMVEISCYDTLIVVF